MRAVVPSTIEITIRSENCLGLAMPFCGRRQSESSTFHMSEIRFVYLKLDGVFSIYETRFRYTIRCQEESCASHCQA